MPKIDEIEERITEYYEQQAKVSLIEIQTKKKLSSIQTKLKTTSRLINPLRNEEVIIVKDGKIYRQN